MMIEKYLKELLFEYDCVILPGFGGFLTQYVCADIHPITHKIKPPSKRLAFNEQLKNDDGLLVEAICVGEQIEVFEAQESIKDFVKKIKLDLGGKRIYDLKEIGKFFINTSDNIEFEPDSHVNYLEDSFALPELYFKPIERNSMNTNLNQRTATKMKKKEEEITVEENSVNDGKKNSLVFVLPIILLLLAGATTFLYYNQENKELAGVNPFVIFGKHSDVTESSKSATEAPKKEVSVAESTNDVPEVTTTVEDEVITSNTGRYFVIVNSFRSKANAMKFREKLEEQNVTASIIEPDSKKKYYRVSIADFADKTTAESKLGEFKESYGNSVWILSY